MPGPEDGLLLGNLPGLPRALDDGADAVVSLCRVGHDDVPAEVEHVQVWLADRDAPANPNLDLVLADTVDALRSLREDGCRVYVHCVGGRSRTPLVAAAYLAQTRGWSGRRALDAVADCLPEVGPNPTFRAWLDGVPDDGA